MNCPNCHSENRDGAKYCDECGFPLSGRIAELAAADDEAAVMAGIALSPNTPPAPEDAEGEDDASAERETLEEEAPREDQLLSVEEDPSFSESSHAADEDLNVAAMDADTPDETDASNKSHESSQLDPVSVPVIAVAGVNADEDGNLFDFELIEDDAIDEDDAPTIDVGEDAEGAGDTEPPEDASPLESEKPSDPDATRAIPVLANAAAPSDLTVDLSGIEQLVDSGYAPPVRAWRSGDTMQMEPVGEQASVGSRKEFRAADASDAESKRRRFPVKVFLIVLGVIALIAAVAGLVTYQMEIWGGHTVPDVVGSSQADAVYELQRQGFTVRTTQVKSDDVEGKVLLTDPSAGSRKAEGTEVVIHVSVSRTVPEVVGVTQDEAVALFEAEECTNVEYQLVKSDETEGTVVSVDPAAGTKIKASTAVVVQVATPYTVPDVAGMSQSEVEAALADAGFVAEVKWVYSEDVDEGLAVSSDPEAGSKLASGSTVVVSLAKSRAKELVNLTYSYFQSAGILTIDGVTYDLDPDAEGHELSVKYQSGSTVSYSIRGRVVEYVETTFFGTQTFYGDWQTLTGTVTWSDDDTIASASPSIS